MRKYYSTIIAFGLLFMLISSCSEKTPPPTEPPPEEIPKDTVSISAGDVTHRSVSINIKSTDNNAGWKVILYRTVNGTDAPISHYPASVNDTTIVDDDNGGGLQLDTGYKYYAVLTDTAGSMQEKTPPVTAKTLAATSHNYTWQEYTIGDAGIQASDLFDVWGTDENNVWAVGTIFIADTAYGVVKWNGNQWLPDKKRGGLKAVYGFANSDVWAVGNSVNHFDGIKWNPIDGYLDFTTGQFIVLDTILLDYTPYLSVWGTSSNNLYLGSERGKIIHWDGQKARIVYSTDMAILGIWGANDNDIYAVASNFSQNTDRLLHYEGASWSVIRTGGTLLGGADTKGPFSSVWGTTNGELYLQADYVESRLGGVWRKEVWAPRDYEISGTNSNNIVSGGMYGIKHFNGVDWVSIDNITQRLLYGIHVFENKIFAVGDGVILIGTKY